jgi:hypothetical protein
MVGVLIYFCVGFISRIISETIRDEFISYNILQKSLAISQSPNIDIGQAALSCFNYFLTYSEYFHITFIGIIIL